jgi:cell division protein FtsQ
MTRAMRLRRRRWLTYGIAGLVVAVIAAAVWVVGFSAALTARHVRVTGLDHLSHQTVTATAAIPARRPLARVDTSAVERRVSDLNQVKSAKVSRSWPDTVDIAVTERKPLYRIKADNTDLVVDRAGVTFTVAAKTAADLPLATLDTDNSRLRSDVGTVLASLPDSLRAKVHRVHASGPDAITLQLTKQRSVDWGNATDSKLKARVLSKLLKQQASVYNVSAPGYPTTR